MTTENTFKYFKTSPKIISLAVMYYMRYPLSFRQVEDILYERGTLRGDKLCLSIP
jgi:putative transposase